jgi:hypothetical protein
MSMASILLRPICKSKLYPSNYPRRGPFSQPDPHFQSGPAPQYQQRNRRHAFMSSSQPVTMERSEISDLEYSQLSEEPSMSQFTSNPHLPESLVIQVHISTDL